MIADMKGFTVVWFEICNMDGHPLVIPQGENRFETEDAAVETAQAVCLDYRDTVTIKSHTTTITRIFHADITVVEA